MKDVRNKKETRTGLWHFVERKERCSRWKHGLSQMEGVDHIIPKEEHAYCSFRHEVWIRRELIPNDMIH